MFVSDLKKKKNVAQKTSSMSNLIGNYLSFSMA